MSNRNMKNIVISIAQFIIVRGSLIAPNYIYDKHFIRLYSTR
ncbi:hypothetical protein SAMN05720766_10179 [Fibrobacter sp. UWH9]|nr:hypothetical protein SAMN05720766_10179 [Fibrobacter sp. UWH9]